MHHGSVLIHCQRGVSRSVTCAVFFLMRKVGMTLESALDLCRARRSVAAPIPAFVEQLAEYEKKCVRIGSIKMAGKKKRKHNDDSGSSCSTKARLEAIGPMLPPNVQREAGRKDVTSLQENKIKDAVIAPPPPPKSVYTEDVIGPVTPSIRVVNDVTGQEESDKSSCAVIGPSLPSPSFYS